MYEGPIKCAVLLEDPKKPENIKIELEHADGSPISKNESLDTIVDIGREEWKYQWTNVPKFTWSFKNYTPDIPDRYWQWRVFTTTYRAFGLTIPRKYQFVRFPTTRTHFVDEFTSDLEVFDGRPSVLAQEYLYHPRNPKDINGLGQWNDNHYFTPYGDVLPAYIIDPHNYTEGQTNSDGSLVTLASQPMLEINMHEKFHGHGFYHDENSPNSLMFPYVKKGYSVQRKFYPDGTNTSGVIDEKAFIWTAEDRKRIQNPFGKRLTPEWILSYFRNRRITGKFVNAVLYRVTV